MPSLPAAEQQERPVQANVGATVPGPQREQEQTERADPWPPWLTTRQALDLSGLPPSWLYAGLRKGLLAASGTKYTRRIHRDDLRAFVERTRGGDFVQGLLEKAT